MAKVLVVDDDPDILEMVTLVLRGQGIDVANLNAGTGFHDVVSSQRPDLVLMDIYLGDADGRELCRELKISEEYSNIPVVLYSAGHIAQASIDRSLADDFFQKPFDISRLINKVERLLPS